MRIVIMQPYLFPYIGYFQLMKAADEFVVYDNIEYTKKGWFNRNRILVNGQDSYITFPLKKDSDYLHVRERYLSENWETERIKLLNRIKESYRKAPFYKEVFPFIEEILMFENLNLFDFTYNSLKKLKDYLGITSKLIVSSEIPIDHNLKGEDKVLEICKALKAQMYINPRGGVDLYHNERFQKEGIQLRFLFSNDIKYEQNSNTFVPWLSIIDVLMFNARETVADNFLSQFLLKKS